LVFIAFVSADYFANQIATTCAAYPTLPRIRQSYFKLDFQDQLNFVNVILQMKKTCGFWRSPAPLKTDKCTSLYNMFVEVHNNNRNTVLWHGTTVFLFIHKYFLNVFESALKYVCVNNYQSLGMTLEQCCMITVPYYPSETDVLPGIAKSPLWNKQVFGSYVCNGQVTDGIFSDPAWICTSNTSLPGKPSDPTLKRLCQPTNNLKDGPTVIAYHMTNWTECWNFTTYMENGPHQAVHTMVAYYMTTMCSPNDPIFFMHHCNLDRLLHFWFDCQGYDTIPSSQLTQNQYANKNPDTYLNGIPPCPKIDWRTNQPYDVSLDGCIMHMFWDYCPSPTMKTSNIECIAFPDTLWATPRQMWPSGQLPNDPGWDGLNVRYGPDDFCNLLPIQELCPDQTWLLVDQPLPSQKRSGKIKDIDPYSQKINAEYGAKKMQGKNAKQALYELAMEECLAVPAERDTVTEKQWFAMTGGAAPERICDKPVDALNGENTVNADKDSKSLVSTFLPAWAIALIAFATIVGLAIIVIVVIIVKKRYEKAPQDNNLYVDLLQN